MTRIWIIACLLILSCKHPSVDSQTKDEGLYIARQRTLDSLVEAIAQGRHWDKARRQEMKASLNKVIPATVHINCGGFRGSGVFVDPYGGFITNFHVLDKSGSCMFSMNSIDGAGNISETKFLSDFEISHKAISTYNFDIAIGKIKNISSPNFLPISPATNLDGRDVVSLGYPTHSFRGEPLSWVRKTEHFAAQAVGVADVCQSAKEIGAEDATVSLDQNPFLRHAGDSELEKLHTMINFLCRYRMANPLRPVSYVYDRIPDKEDENPLAISIGKIVYADKYRAFADVDTLNGMSGGPIVDLKTSSLVGINRDSYGPKMKGTLAEIFPRLTYLDQRIYLGMAVPQILSNEVINEFKLSSIIEQITPSQTQPHTAAEYQACARAFDDKLTTPISRIFDDGKKVIAILIDKNKAYSFSFLLKSPKETKNLKVVISGQNDYHVSIRPTGDSFDEREILVVDDKNEGTLAGVEIVNATPIDWQDYQAARAGKLQNAFESLMKYIAIVLEDTDNDQHKSSSEVFKMRRDALKKYGGDFDLPQLLEKCAPSFGKDLHDKLKAYFGI